MNLYVETSVWNMRVDAEEVNRQKRVVTGSFFEEARAGRHRVFVSPLVLEEIAADPDPRHRAMVMDGIRRLRPSVLEQTELVLDIGRQYVKQGIIPEKYEDDAVHIAYAVVNRLDAIVSWNLAHIVKVKTRKAVAEYNQRQGIHVPDIATPEEVLENV
ncbi:MAG: type II toxin-antitoxin system VapC family toxin [Planctomycetes bacterium]|nr:type II toxin-antitoxin system VapC family toxin [Planctomycetota bacterium]MBM4078291.1 type II toxin-antitoxin system VapC family toxin [Planctomycetota bacterium]MBM4083559.1 type II toxin-antitoxin system VapC family toxin [Planctomycetota bacterium]